MSAKILYITWQGPKSRQWYPIGRLTFSESLFRFEYVNGALKAKNGSKFEPFRAFPDLEQAYESQNLFPLFENRVLQKDREEFADYVDWLGLPKHPVDPLIILARSGGTKATDPFEVFPLPQPDENGDYHIHFFAHGLSYLPAGALDRISRLEIGEELLLAVDFQNPFDKYALLLRTRDNHIVGYYPGYLLEDAWEVFLKNECTLTVERVNLPPAPLQFRLLCRLVGKWPEGFTPFRGEFFQPVKPAALTAKVSD